MQHNPFCWKVDKKNGDFVYLEYRSDASLRQEVAMNRWLVSLDEKQKSHMVDLIFLILDPDSNGLIDFYHHRLKQAVTIYRRYRKANKEDKGFIRFCLKRLFKIYRVADISRSKYKKTTIYDDSLKSPSYVVFPKN